MADELDRAAAQTQLSSDAAVAAIRARIDAPGSMDCASCGEAIPLARRQALPSARRCVSCQGAADRRGRGRG